MVAILRLDLRFVGEIADERSQVNFKVTGLSSKQPSKNRIKGVNTSLLAVRE
jgi:hypothetical protein